ncbi:MAG: protein-S-isoprenylcysteine O-methyltransferase [Amphiamblys sp. WSBS2006]|nr:MAG: protein-S-isoprenylcysteine O-methyltransferase [Amphiamblys sp. WSBS2006]
MQREGKELAKLVATSFFLGIFFAAGVFFCAALKTTTGLSYYLAVLSLFYITDWTLSTVYSKEPAKIVPLLTRENTEYRRIHTLSVAEFVAERLLLRSSPTKAGVVLIGLVLSLAGILLRVIDAKDRKEHSPRLFTTEVQDALPAAGIHRYIRYPRYTGFLLFLLGSLVLLETPICTCFCVYQVWSLVKEKIEEEESLLKEKFPRDAERRQQTVFSGAFFIN